MKQTARSTQRGLTAGEIMTLQEHRLSEDLPYRTLAVRIGIGLSKLHDLLNNPTVIANERTAFKVRRYLATINAPNRVSA